MCITWHIRYWMCILLLRTVTSRVIVRIYAKNTFFTVSFTSPFIVVVRTKRVVTRKRWLRQLLWKRSIKRSRSSIVKRRSTRIEFVSDWFCDIVGMQPRSWRHPVLCMNTLASFSVKRVGTGIIRHFRLTLPKAAAPEKFEKN